MSAFLRVVTQRLFGTLSHLPVLIFFHLNPGGDMKDRGCLVGRLAGGDMPSAAHGDVALALALAQEHEEGTTGRER